MPTACVCSKIPWKRQRRLNINEGCISKFLFFPVKPRNSTFNAIIKFSTFSGAFPDLFFFLAAPLNVPAALLLTV